jgi:hypothetical protein
MLLNFGTHYEFLRIIPLKKKVGSVFQNDAVSWSPLKILMIGYSIGDALTLSLSQPHKFDFLQIFSLIQPNFNMIENIYFNSFHTQIFILPHNLEG